MGLYLVESFKGVNIFAKLAFIFLLLAQICGWIAYCTPDWGRNFPGATNTYFKGYGVWLIADNNDDNPQNPATNNNAPAPSITQLDGWLLKWYGAFQAFASFGFISLNVGFWLVILFVFVAPCKSNSDLSFWNAINNFFGSSCWLVAVCIFGSSFNKAFDGPFYLRQLHYSFGFAVITIVFQLIAAIVLLLSGGGNGVVANRPEAPHHKQTSEPIHTKKRNEQHK